MKIIWDYLMVTLITG